MTAGHAGRRPQREDAALAALLSEPTIEAAARKAGIGESTLLRWLQEPDFKDRYRTARRQVVEHAIVGLQQATGEAVETLRRNLTCGVPAAEISAAKAIIEQAVKATDLLDHEARIAALEVPGHGEPDRAA